MTENDLKPCPLIDLILSSSSADRGELINPNVARILRERTKSDKFTFFSTPMHEDNRFYDAWNTRGGGE